MRHVYLAGPITGLTYDEAAGWRADDSLFVQALVERDWISLSPMRGKDKFKLDGPLPSDFDEGAAAVARDLSDISASSAVVVNFGESARLSLGTLAEMGYAYALNKPIIVVRAPGNATYDHVFVKYMAHHVVPNLDVAIIVLERIARELTEPAYA